MTPFLTWINVTWGFFTPQRLDSNDIGALNVPSLRSQMALVAQEPALFDRTLAENIAYGDNSREVDMEEIMRAARAANIHNFITSLPGVSICLFIWFGILHGCWKRANEYNCLPGLFNQSGRYGGSTFRRSEAACCHCSCSRAKPKASFIRWSYISIRRGKWEGCTSCIRQR